MYLRSFDGQDLPLPRPMPAPIGVTDHQQDGVPLSFIQESLWLLDKMADAPAFNEPLAFHIRGPLRADALRRAMHLVVERHDPLRTTIVQTPAGLTAVVQDQFHEFVEVVDLRHQDRTSSWSVAQELIQKSYRLRFDLGRGLPIRAVIVLVGEDESLFCLTIHHTATDGWSMGIILEEIQAHYVSLCRSNKPAVLPPLSARYEDFVLGQRRAYEKGAFERQIEYWRGALEGAPQLLKLPIDRARPPLQTFKGSTRSIRIPKEKIAPLLDQCNQECDATEFMVLLAAYAVLLNRYTGQDSITVGTPVLNRNSYDVLDLVGCFVDTIALPLELDGEMTFRDLLARVSANVLAMLNQQQAPYHKVLTSLNIPRDLSHNPVFQTMLTLLGPKQVLDLGDGVACTPFPLQRTAAKYDLLLYVSEFGDMLELEAEFNTDLFDVATIERLLNHLVVLLERLPEDIDRTISTISFLSEAERSLIIDVWNDTLVDYPRTTVIDMFEAQAQTTPSAVAVEFNDRLMTYDELNRAANQLARRLIERLGASSQAFVGVCMERSIEMVVALLATVKAGYAYVPIDPEYPSDRIRFMIEDSAVPVVLTQENQLQTLLNLGVETIVLSDLGPTVEDADNVARQLSPDSPVYMIYTSGSTGKPKGVINRHVSLFNRLYWMQSMYGLTGDDRILQKTPFSFDVSVWEFFWPLMFGARIVMANPGGHRDTEYLRDVIFNKKITTLHFVPSMLNVFLEGDELPNFCGSLRRVFCSGEALSRKTVERFYEEISCELHNLYGPTEAAIDVSFWRCSLDYPRKIVPIGAPIANVQLFVLDKAGQLQPIGVPGELCIGGVGVAKGYHNRDELTRKAFVEDPFSREPGARLYKTGDLARYLPDGQIEYLGRIDNQIKLRGFRIELGEIEEALKSLPSVKDGTVVLHETTHTKMLVAYVVGRGFDQRVARDLLRKQLPEFMLPQVFVELPEIPTNANGKLDRKALPDPFAGTRTVDKETAPISLEAATLSRIWKDVLGVSGIGLDTNFFALGGDSILSIRVAGGLQELGYAVDIHEVFTHPTIRQLADLMATRGRRDGRSVETPFCLVGAEDRMHLPENVEEAWPLTALQSGMIYHTLRHEEMPVYHDIFAFDIQAGVDRESLFQALGNVVARHPQLRSAFDLSTFSEPLQLVYRDVTVPVRITDVTHLSRKEQDEVVCGWFEAEKQHGFDLEHPPLIRMRVHVRSKEEMNLGISFHHAVLDGWSVAVVLEEFRRSYGELLRQRQLQLPPERVPYSTYVNLERRALGDPAHASFWAEKVAGIPTSVLSRVNPNGGFAVPPAALSSIERPVSQSLASSLQQLTGEANTPFKSVLLGLHLHVLGRILDQPEVVTGLVVNGRPEIGGSDELVGLFLNTVPFRIELLHEGWPSLFKRVFELEQEMLPYRRFPVAEIQKRSSNNKLFDVVFNYTDFHVYKSHEDDVIRIVGAQYFEQTNYGVVVHVHRDHFTKQMRLIVNYDASTVDAGLVERYIECYLEAAVKATTHRLLTAGHIGGEIGLARNDETENDSKAVAPRGLRVGEYVAPRTSLEKQIGTIVSQAIGLERLGLDDNYLELGLDSITAIRILAKVKKLGIDLTMQDLFDCQTVRRAAVTAEARGGRGPLPTALSSRPLRPFELPGPQNRPFPTKLVDAYPATSLQLDMIQQSQTDVEQAIYHDIFSYHLALPLDQALMRKCLSRVMNGHDTFRTAFALEGYSTPMQLVYESIQPQMQGFDLSSMSDRQQEQAFTDWFEREKGKGFDWATPGLIRFYAHKWSPDDFTLTLSFHHSILDGWSLALFVRELLDVYIESLNSGYERELKFPMLRYREYVGAELETRHSDVLRSFWQDQLRGFAYNSLPRAGAVNQGSRWSERKIPVGPARQKALVQLSRRLSVPLKHVMLSCHTRVMSLVCTEKDVLTGTFASCRLEEDEGESILGLFLNFIPFRQKIGDQTWSQFIQETFEIDRGLLPGRRYPLASIESAVGRRPLFETVFNYTNFKAYRELSSADDLQHGKQVLKDVRWFEHTNFSLLANVGYDIQERLEITLNAHGHVLPQGQLDVVGGIYDSVLNQILESEDRKVSDIPGELATLVAALGDVATNPSHTEKAGP